MRHPLVPAELPDHVVEEELAVEGRHEDADAAEQVADVREQRNGCEEVAERYCVLGAVAPNEREGRSEVECFGKFGII